MSKELDEKIVSMEFDNKNFEKNISTSIKSLNKLKENLEFEDAGKGLDELNRSIKKVDFTPMSEAIETVSVKFNALQAAGFAVMENLVNKAMNVGERLVKSLSVDQWASGFSKYESKISNMQTIMNSTGKSVEEIEGYLDELSWYADETSYGISDMMTALSSGIAAGRNIEELIPMIEGVANATAFAGKNAAEFGHVMTFAMNQALQLGYLGNLDWKTMKSISTPAYQQAYLDAAEKLGKITSDQNSRANWGTFLTDKVFDTDVIIEANKSFAEYTRAVYEARQAYIDKGDYKSTADVMKELAKDYGAVGVAAFQSAQTAKTFTEAVDAVKDAVSTSWSDTWEILFGNINEAKKLWTDFCNNLYDIFGPINDIRNEFLAGIFREDLGKGVTGQMVAIDAIMKTMENLVKILELVQGAWFSIFPKSQQIKAGQNAVKFLRQAVVLLTPSQTTLMKIRVTLQGLFSLLDVIGSALKDVLLVGMVAIDYVMKTLGSRLVLFVAEMNSWFVRTRNVIKANEILKNSLYFLLGVFVSIVDAIDGLFEAGLNSKRAIGILTNAATALGYVLKGIGAFIGGIIYIVENVVVNAASIVGNVVKKIFTFGDSLEDFCKRLKAVLEKTVGHEIKSTFGAIVSVLQIIWRFIYKIGSQTVVIMKKIAGAAANAFKGGDLDQFFKLINEGLLTMILNKIKNFLTNLKNTESPLPGIIKDLIGNISDAFKEFQNSLKANVIVKIALSIGLLAAALYVLSGVDGEALKGSLTAITVLFTELMASLAGYTKLSGKITNVAKSSIIMITVSLAIYNLAKALAIIAGVDKNNAMIGVGIIGGLMVELAVMSKAMTKVSGNVGKLLVIGMAMIAMGASMKIFASAMNDMKDLSLTNVGVALAAIGGVMTIIALFTRIAKGAGGLLVSSIAVVILGAAMEILANVMSKMADIEWESIGKMGASLAGLLLIVALFNKFGGFKGGLMVASVAMVILGSAMEILANVMTKMSDLEWTGIGKAVAGIAGLLLVVALFNRLYGSKAKIVASTMSLVIIGAAMEIFANVISHFKDISLDTIMTAVIGIGGILLVIQQFVKMADSSGKLLAASVALVIFGGAMGIMASVSKKFDELNPESVKTAAVFAGGLMLIALAFSKIAGNAKQIITGAIGILIIAGALGSISDFMVQMKGSSWGDVLRILVIIAGLFITLGVAAKLLAPYIPIIDNLAGELGLLGLAFLSIGLGATLLTTALVALGGASAAAAVSVVSAASIITAGLLEMIPMLHDKMREALESLCRLLIETSPAFAAAIPAIAQTISDVITEVVPIILKGLTKLFKGITENVPQLIPAFIEMVVALLGALAENLPALIDGVVSFFLSLIDALSIHIPRIVEGILNFISKIIDAIADKISIIITSIIGLIGSIIEGIANAIGPIVEATLGPILGMIEGIIVGVANALAPYMGDLQGIVEVISNGFVKMTEALAPNLPAIIDAISRLAMVIGTIFVEALKVLAPYIPKILTFTKEITKIVVDAIVEITNALIDHMPEVKEIILDIGNTLRTIAEVILAVVQTILPSMEIVRSIIIILGGLIIAVMEEVKTTTQSVFDGIIGIMETVESTIETTLSGLDSIITDVFDGINTTLTTTLTGTKEIIETFFDGSEDIVRETFEGIAGVISAPFEGVDSILDTALSGIKGIIDSIGTSFDSIGTGTKDLADAIKTLTDLNLADMALSVTKVTSALKDWSEYGDAIKKVGDGMKGIGDTMITTTKSITTMTGDVSNMIGLFLNMSSESVNVANLFSLALDSMTKKCEQSSEIFYNDGKSVITDFANGITAAKTFFDTAVNGILNSFQTKVTNSGGKFYNIGKTVGNKMVDGITDAIATIQSIIENDPNMQPVIRPVMDLTELQNGVNEMNNLLNGSSLSGSYGMAGAANYSMNTRGNDNLELIKAVNDLSDKVGTGGTSYTINGITYSDGTSVADAVTQLVRAAVINKRSGGTSGGGVF